MAVTQTLSTAALCVVLLVGVYWQCFAESVFVLNPLIDTRLPQGFTQANFDRIQQGMTKAEVLQLIPPPEQEIKENQWGYGNDGASLLGDYAWFRFDITFDQEGKVLEKKQVAYHD